MRRPTFIRGIRDKMIVAFSALIASIALFIVLFFPARLHRQALEATVAKASAVGSMAAFSLGAGLMFDDTTAVEEVLNGVLAAGDVAYLAVWNARDEPIASRGVELAEVGSPGLPSTRVSDDGNTLVTTLEVTSGNARVGALALGLSLAPLEAQRAGARRVGALIGMLVLLFGLLAILAISTLVTRPLLAVAETVNRIAGGDLKSRAAETDDEETRGLVRAFNHMIDTLAGAQADLASANAELEQRVAARTSELTEAIEQLRRSKGALVLSEAEARQTSELLQSLIDVAPQAIVAVDTDWKVQRWNHAAERLFGWSAAEVIGSPMPFLPTADAVTQADEQLARTAADRAEPIEVVRLRKDGTPLSVLLAAATLRDKDQAAIGYIGILTDLTERKRLETQLRQSQKMEAMGRLAGGIAHDFNNILTIITACTELLISAAKEGDDRSLLEHISGAAARAAALTRQLLTFTRQQVVQPKPVDVGAVVAMLEPMLRRVLPANIRLKMTSPRGLGDVIADSTQVEQVVMNLVMNANDAMPAGGTLDVELAPVDLSSARGAELGLTAGPHLRLLVRDSGMGIDEAVINRIFDPFFTTKEIGKGTGLGLATVYGIVASLGGVINVRSTRGQGTTFELHLPLSLDTTTGEPGSGPSVRPTAVAATPRRILLVEDERLVRQVIRRSLTQVGFEVVEAADGEQAMLLVAQGGGQLDAVITDMMMPGMGGRAFMDMLRETHPDLGVVCISGYTESEISGGPLLDDRHVFVQKPFSNRQLLEAVAAVTRRAPLASR